MKRLKVTVVFLLITVLIMQNETQGAELSASDRNQIALDCIRQVGIEESVVRQAIAGNIPKNDSKYKDFLACSYKKQGYQAENGDILIDGVKTFLAKFYFSTDLEILNACAGNNGANHGENAFNALRCIMQQLKTLTPKNTTDL